MAKVAFIGLGVMGYPMARHLQAKGHEVTVYNRNAAKSAKWVSEFGGRAAPTPSGGRMTCARPGARRQTVPCAVGSRSTGGSKRGDVG